MISSESSEDEAAPAPRTQVKPVAPTPATTSTEQGKKVKERNREEKKIRRDKKRKEREEQRQQELQQKQQERALKKQHIDSKAGRNCTLSLAVPGSILDNAQTKELKTYLAGQVARACVVFQVDEIIVFDDQLGNKKANATTTEQKRSAHDCHTFFLRILQYLDTPQYLRRALFPMHADLSCAGLLNPLDAPHHVRAHEWSPYREGVVSNRQVKGDADACLVNVGYKTEVVVDKRIQSGVRVTVKLDESTKNSKKMRGTLVSSSEPRQELGTYWGYNARFASSLQQVWQDCPFEGGYDLKVGTSERGHVSVDDDDFTLPSFHHALIVFGGVAGIEECVNADESIHVSGDDSHTLFDMWVNTCPAQGSRTIRTEEAILISMASLRPHLKINGIK